MDVAVKLAEQPQVRARAESYHRAQRLIDIIVALLVLSLTWPLILLMCLLTRLDSPGPAIFKQTRVGKGGKLFTFYKFRTMYQNARQLYPYLYRYEYTPEEIATMYFKSLNDPRLTRFGTAIRKTSLDELPNLFNVLRGDMSLIGPRPDIPEMVKYYTNYQMRKFDVKPGVTGLAQTLGRGLLTFQETLQADVCYVENESWRLDLKIVIDTVRVMLQRLGAF